MGGVVSHNLQSLVRVCASHSARSVGTSPRAPALKGAVESKFGVWGLILRLKRDPSGIGLTHSLRSARFWWSLTAAQSLVYRSLNVFSAMNSSVDRSLAEDAASAASSKCSLTTGGFAESAASAHTRTEIEFELRFTRISNKESGRIDFPRVGPEVGAAKSCTNW